MVKICCIKQKVKDKLQPWPFSSLEHQQYNWYAEQTKATFTCKHSPCFAKSKSDVQKYPQLSCSHFTLLWTDITRNYLLNAISAHDLLTHLPPVEFYLQHFRLHVEVSDRCLSKLPIFQTTLGFSTFRRKLAIHISFILSFTLHVRNLSYKSLRYSCWKFLTSQLDLHPL